MRTEHKKANCIWELVFSGMAALVIALQSPLHPFASALPATDSAVYIYTAQQMAAGKTLYLDLFEHKGPLLYLLNFLPLRLSAGNTGAIWLLELLLMFLNALLIIRIAGLFTDKTAVKVLAMAAALYPLGFYFEGGNFTEEYALPFLLGALYIFLEYMTGKKESLPVKKICLAGFFCGMVILLRINMIVEFGAYCFILVLFFMKHGRWKEIGQSILAFAGGLAASLIPAAAVLAVTGVFRQFWEAYFVYNMDYSVGSNGLIDILRAVYVFWTREPMLPVSLVVLTGMLIDAVRNRDEDSCWIGLASLVTLGGSLYAVAMSGRTYGHYAMILLPGFIVPSVMILETVYKKMNNTMAVAVLCTLALVSGAPKNAAGFMMNIMGTMRADAGQQEIISYITEHSEEEDDVLILGNYCMYYLGAERSTDSRFFYQNPTLDVRDDYREQFEQELAEEPPVLIVEPEGDLPFESEYIEKLAEQGLYDREDKGSFVAYKRNVENKEDME